MRIFIHVLLFIILLFPTSSFSQDYKPDSFEYIHAYETTIDFSGIITFSSSDAIIYRSYLQLTSSPFNRDIQSHLIDSFIATVKINAYLMTIKFGSTLINPSYSL